MPVDLSSIPEKMVRKRQPSLKRWSVALLLFLVCGGFFTSWLWSVQQVARGALFWHCFITAPLVLWIVLFSVRWLLYLVTVWPAEGWDDEREQDISNEIRRGQRYLLLMGASVNLPHFQATTTLSQHFIMPQGVVLPVVVDEITQDVSYKAEFKCSTALFSERVIEQINTLIESPVIQNHLLKSYTGQLLSVVVQIEDENELSEEDCLNLHNQISLLLPSLQIHFRPCFGWEDIDHWLDFPDYFDDLLILSINLRSDLSDGEGEAAIALLLRFADEDRDADSSFAHIHRPENNKDILGLNNSVSTALLWGKTRSDDIASVWLAGMGAENKIQSLLASSNLKFPRAEASGQLIDIDMKSGYTGIASPWLSLALAAGNSAERLYPQLVLSIPDRNISPWCLVIQPSVPLSMQNL